MTRLIIAGGGMANCCEPMAEFIDLFVLGEAEEAIVQLVELVRECKRSGDPNRRFFSKRPNDLTGRMCRRCINLNMTVKR